MEEEKTTTCEITQIKLTDRQVELLVDCGALHYESDMVSDLLLITEEEAGRLLSESDFKKHYDHGKALAKYRIESKLLEMATQGDLSAIDKLKKIQRSTK